jgi:hypothetical protein
MKKLFLILFLFSASYAFSQTINWQQTHGWRLYHLHDKKGMRVLPDSLSLANSRALDDDSIQFFLSGVSKIQRGDEPVWMGAIILSCLDSTGSFRKIDVSVYGGFFYDEQLRKYFQVREEIRTAWLEYLTGKLEEMER